MLHHQQGPKEHKGWLRQILGISSKYEKHGDSGELRLAQKEKPLALSEKKKQEPLTHHRYHEEIPGKVRKTVVLTESTKHDAKKQVETEGEGGGEEVEIIEITRVKKEFVLEDRPGAPVRKQVLVSRGPIIEEGVVTEEEEDEHERQVLKVPTVRSRRVSSEPRTVRHYIEELREPDIERRKYVTREVREEPLERPRKLSARTSDAPSKKYYYVEHEDEEPERREVREEPLQRPRKVSAREAPSKKYYAEFEEEEPERREVREEPLVRHRKLPARAPEAPVRKYVEFEEEEPERREVREEPPVRHRKLSARYPEDPERREVREEVAPTTVERVYVSEPRAARYREPPQTRREVPEYYVGEQGQKVEEPIVRKPVLQDEPEYIYRKPLKKQHITPPMVRPPSPKPTVQARISSDVQEAVNGEHLIRIEERPGPSLEEERTEIRRAEAGTRYSPEAELSLPSIVKSSPTIATTAERSVRERESPSRIIRTEEREITPPRKEYREPPEFLESEEARQQEESGRRTRPIPKAKLGHRRRRLIEEEREQSASPVLMRKEPTTKYPKEYEEREVPTESPDRYSDDFPPLEASEPSDRERSREGREGTTVTYSGSALAGYRQESGEEGEGAREAQ